MGHTSGVCCPGAPRTAQPLSALMSGLQRSTAGLGRNRLSVASPQMCKVTSPAMALPLPYQGFLTTVVPTEEYQNPNTVLWGQPKHLGLTLLMNMSLAVPGCRDKCHHAPRTTGWQLDKGLRNLQSVRPPLSSLQLTQKLSWHWHREAGPPLHPFLLSGSRWEAAGQTGVGRRNAGPRPLRRDGERPVRPGPCGSPVPRSPLSHWQSGCEAAELKGRESVLCRPGGLIPASETQLRHLSILSPSPTSQGPRTACCLL